MLMLYNAVILNTYKAQSHKWKYWYVVPPKPVAATDNLRGRILNLVLHCWPSNHCQPLLTFDQYQTGNSCLHALQLQYTSWYYKGVVKIRHNHIKINITITLLIILLSELTHQVSRYNSLADNSSDRVCKDLPGTSDHWREHRMTFYQNTIYPYTIRRHWKKSAFITLPQYVCSKIVCYLHPNRNNGSLLPQIPTESSP